MGVGIFFTCFLFAFRIHPLLLPTYPYFEMNAVTLNHYECAYGTGRGKAVGYEMAWLKAGAGESERGDKPECEIPLACQKKKVPRV